MTSRMLPRIEPISDALTTSCSPSLSAKNAMISSGALPNVTFRKPPMPGPERAASSSVARPISAAVGITPSADAMKMMRRRRVRQLERDRDRDERDEQVRPAVAAQQEPAQVEPAVRCSRGHGRRTLARRLGDSSCQPLSRSAHLRAFATSEPASVRHSEYFSRSAEPPRRPSPTTIRRRSPLEPPSAAEAAELAEQLVERLGVRGLGDLLVLVEVGDREVERRPCRRCPPRPRRRS